MKKKVLLIILCVTCISLTGCFGKRLSSKRYEYNTEGDSVYSYYKCGSKKICTRYLYIKGIGTSEAKYEYEFKKKQEDGTYVIKFTNLKKTSDNYEIIYDKEEESLYDTDLKISYEIK